MLFLKPAFVVESEFLRLLLLTRFLMSPRPLGFFFLPIRLSDLLFDQVGVVFLTESVEFVP